MDCRPFTSTITRPILKGNRIPCRRGSFAQITDISEAVAAGKVREIAIAREVGDSVLYHSLFGLASPQQVLGAFVRDAGLSCK